MHKKQKKRLKKIERRIAELEQNSTAMSFYLGKELTFPEFVRWSEKSIALSEGKNRQGRKAD